MGDSANLPQRVRFGAFEVDLRAGELWKSGRKLKLTGQPFTVLAVLLERPGEVISREELQKRLWPDTFVDVDHNLNTAINKIREALNDSPEQPRFVETLSRRGYRFIAPVESVMPAASVPNGAATVSGIAFETGSIGAASESVASVQEIAPPQATAESPVSAAAPGIPTWARVAGWSLASVAALTLAWFLRPTLSPPQVTGTTQLTHDGVPKLLGVGERSPALLTDGSRIYFEEGTGFKDKLMQVSTDGGEAVPVEIPFGFEGTADIVPNRAELLVGGPPHEAGSNEAGLWLLPVPGGQPRRVGSLVAEDATWSPDGTAIYYSQGTDIFTAESDGSQPRKILTTGGSPSWLRFSPDGSVLRFSVLDTQSPSSSLWEARPDGSHLQQMFAASRSLTSSCCGNWTSDGKYFIFQSIHEGVSNLWAMREKGDLWRKVSHEPVQLTQGEITAQAPVPSKDGTKVFFIGSARRNELLRYDQKTHAFTPYLAGVSADGLTFTRDGQRVAYVSYPEGILWQSRADGSDRHELTFSPMEVFLPRWSPDGTRIAFSARESGKTWQLFIMPAQGGQPEQLTSGELDALDPSWSPDGNSLAFGEGALQVRSSHQNAIHILDLKTRKVTDVPGSEGVYSPRWSPDGRYLLAETANFKKLVVYDFTLRKWEDLAKMWNAYPNWSHDGKCVYFNNAFDKGLPVYRICLNDRKLEHIIDLSPAGNLALGRFGWWSGIGPDDSILATRDISIEEIYALDTKFP